MDTRRWSAFILVVIMALAGCLGATEPLPEVEEPTVTTYSLEPTWILSPSDARLGEEVTYVLGIKQEGEGVWTIDATVLQPNFSPLADIEWTEIDSGYQLKFTPIETGEHIISITIENDGETDLVPPLKPLVMTLNMNPPDEPAPFSPYQTDLCSKSQMCFGSKAASTISMLIPVRSPTASLTAMMEPWP